MSGASSIAIFLLATTLRNSIDNRIVPIAATWGAGFEHLYFVMGTNIVDKKYLDSSCEIQPILSHRLLARAPQLQPQNELLEYQCIPGGLPIRVLFTANCTGTYFGIGPTCRCQESMRFFWTAPRFRDTQWFMFIDDDLYIRRLPLMTMLSGFNDRLHEPISIIRMSNVCTVWQSVCNGKN